MCAESPQEERRDCHEAFAAPEREHGQPAAAPQALEPGNQPVGTFEGRRRRVPLPQFAPLGLDPFDAGDIGDFGDPQGAARHPPACIVVPEEAACAEAPAAPCACIQSRSARQFTSIWRRE